MIILRERSWNTIPGSILYCQKVAATLSLQNDNVAQCCPHSWYNVRFVLFWQHTTLTKQYCGNIFPFFKTILNIIKNIVSMWLNIDLTVWQWWPNNFCGEMLGKMVQQYWRTTLGLSLKTLSNNIYKSDARASWTGMATYQPDAAWFVPTNHNIEIGKTY